MHVLMWRNLEKFENHCSNQLCHPVQSSVNIVANCLKRTVCLITSENARGWEIEWGKHRHVPPQEAKKVLRVMTYSAASATWSKQERKWIRNNYTSTSSIVCHTSNATLVPTAPLSSLSNQEPSRTRATGHTLTGAKKIHRSLLKTTRLTWR